MNWFECKIKIEKPIEEGMTKKVTEAYLVDALTYAEAEARIIEMISPFVITGELEVMDIKRARYSEVFDNENGDKWFRCKLSFVSLDERSGAEKKTSTNMLVQAGDLRDAIKYLDQAMKTTLSDYEISSVTETLIFDVFPYSAEATQSSSESQQAEG